MEIQVASCCDQGKIRKENQDCLIIDEKNHLYCVSDGMGGLAYGKATAEMVKDQLPVYIRQIKERKLPIDEDSLEIIIKKISQNIQMMGNVFNGETLYGATLTGILIQEEKSLIMNVGDSRVYRYKNHELIQLTKDQSLVQYWIDKGKLTKEKAKTHDMRNVILQFMGKAPYVDPLVEEIQIQENEIYCICSDGLFGMIEESQIQEILENNQTLEEKCFDLVNKANQAGGKDNISVILVEIKE